MTTTTVPRPAPSRRPRLPLARRPRIRSTTGRIRALAALAVPAVLLLAALIALAVRDAQDGLRVIGHTAGPEVVATGDLYFALSDMDAQLANALLVGGEPSLAGRRAAALQRYDQRRDEADRALLQSARVAGNDATAQTTARTMLDALGRYERLAGQALLLDGQQHHTAGPPPAQVTALYRQAADVMKLEVLPNAYNLTLANGAKVRRTYEARRSAVLDGRIWVILAGLLLVGVLAGTQVFLTARFRRLVNPPLALATLGAVVLVAVSTATLSGEAARLREAKVDGFDAILALSRARAISTSADADQSRYLLDPGRADTYQQVYLDKSQTVLYVPAENLEEYDTTLDRRIGGTGFMGFLGTEAHHVTLPGQETALRKVLTAYDAMQHEDRGIRRLVAAGDRRDAITARLGAGTAGFQRYDASLTALENLHQAAFQRAVRAGDGALRGWTAGLPTAAVVLIILVLAGVRPRLSEYR